MAAKPRKWIRKRSAAVIRAEKREARAEVRDYATGKLKLETSSPTNRTKYGKYFPPDVAAAEARGRTAYFQNRVNDRWATGELRRRRNWTLAKANIGRDKRTGRFVTRALRGRG
jgi:hypothetical protein